MRQGFVLGYTAEIAVSQNHFIVAQRVTQNKNDNGSLLPMVEEVERQCRQAPRRMLADSGFFSRDNVEQLEEHGLDGYLPDSNLARELNGLGEANGIGSHAVQHAGIQRMRYKLRTPACRQQYARRKQLVEPVIGSLKEHGGMRAFQRRGLAKLAVE